MSPGNVWVHIYRKLKVNYDRFYTWTPPQKKNCIFVYVSSHRAVINIRYQYRVHSDLKRALRFFDTLQACSSSSAYE